MFNSNPQEIKAFIVTCYLIILVLIVFVVTIVYLYTQKQHTYFKEIEKIKAFHENTILQSQLEIQEQTFQNISREIHDNIGQKLSLAKLSLNAVGINRSDKDNEIMSDSVRILTDAISDLSDLSRSMSAEQILHNGLVSALEYEVAQLRKSGIFKATLITRGNMLYFDRQKELVLFRIVQEAINNIVKHAAASEIFLELDYAGEVLNMSIKDNGKGFFEDIRKHAGIGLLNMKKRAQIIGGELVISTSPGTGTTLMIKLPSQYETNSPNQHHISR